LELVELFKIKKKQMKAIDFYKFINDNDIEFHWHTNDETKERDVIFFPYYWQIEYMKELLSATDFDDSGIPCRMMDGYFAFWASDILDGWGIELTEVFGEDTD